MAFLDNLINGISLGSIYAVIALGYTLVYGIAKMLNFAHGDVIMVGGYIIYTAMTSALQLNGYLSVLIAIVGCTVLGITIEKVAYKPLRQATSLAVLITAIGVSYFLQNMALLIFGEKPVTFTSIITIPKLSLFDGQIVIKSEAIASIIVSVIIVVGLSLFVNKTKSGRAMLAVSEDKDAAQLMGINVNRTISLTFAIGSGLAAVAGALLCSTYPVLSNTTGPCCRGIRQSRHSCRRFRRDRIYPRSYDRRTAHWCYRDTRKSVCLSSACRCYRVCCADRSAYCQAYGYTRQEGQRKSLNTERNDIP